MIYILGVISSLIQPQIVLLNLPALFLVFLEFKDKIGERLYLTAFFLGLLTDFLVGNRAGTFAVCYLLLIFVISLIKQRFTINLLLTFLIIILSQGFLFYARGLF